MFCPYTPFAEGYRRVFVYCGSGDRSPVTRDIERLEDKHPESARLLRATIAEFETKAFNLIPHGRWRRINGVCNLEIRPMKSPKVLRVLALGYPHDRFERFILLALYEETHSGKGSKIDKSTLGLVNKRALECLSWLDEKRDQR
jgi:hypothetical protein